MRILIIILLAVGCTQGQENKPEQGTSGDSLSNLPEHLRDLENLTVYSDPDSPSHEIRFHKEVAYEPPDLIEFRRYNDVAAGDSGQFYVSRGADIYAYGKEGDLVATLGGEGRGPGEHHRMGKNELRVGGNRLYTYDDQLSRINVFSLDTFEPSETIIVSNETGEGREDLKNRYPGNTLLKTSLYHTFQDSLLLVRFNDPVPSRSWIRSNNGRYVLHEVPSHFYLLNLRGEVVSDRILTIDFGWLVAGKVSGFSPLPIHRQSLMEVTSEGKIITANTREFLIRIHNPDGTYDRAIYYPKEPPYLDLEKFISSYTDSRELRDNLLNSELPEYWPLLVDMIVDDEDRIWLSTYTGDDHSYLWYVLSRSGELLASFEWPAQHYYPLNNRSRGGIYDIRDGYLFSFDAPDENNPNEGDFVRYRFELTMKDAGE